MSTTHFLKTRKFLNSTFTESFVRGLQVPRGTALRLYPVKHLDQQQKETSVPKPLPVMSTTWGAGYILALVSVLLIQPELKVKTFINKEPKPAEGEDNSDGNETCLVIDWLKLNIDYDSTFIENATTHCVEHDYSDTHQIKRKSRNNPSLHQLKNHCHRSGAIDKQFFLLKPPPERKPSHVRGYRLEIPKIPATIYCPKKKLNRFSS